ncbi:MAG: hypothetical protein IJ057_07865 [Bacteroidales bacterium]|nr:hypothetical protein [Bacteroidales bacterium]
MKRILAIVMLLVCEGFAFGQATKSYLIADYNEKDLAFLQAKCRQASLDMSLSVLANRVATDSKHVSPKPSKHLLKQGVLKLQLPMNESQDEFAVYHSDIFKIPSTINVLQIDDELITYRTMETAGNIHLLYHCTRGAFGSKKSAHAKNAVVYKLWDSPERTLLPDLELQDQMAQAEAKKLAKSNIPLLVFNDLKSYGYCEQGDLAIGHFLDTIRKYNPDKILQGDLLTPMSAQRLERVNENQLWNASMRTKIIETLDEKQDFYRKRQMPWMIGNFQILLSDKNRPATTYEELEWFLSKAAAYDAGFGLIFDAETMRKHGLTPIFLKAVNIWETLRLAGVFSEAQKEQFKDPYGNWHIAKENDSTYSLYAEHISRRFFCNFEDDTWEWNSPYKSRFALQIAVEGKGSISELNFRTPNGILYFPCTLKAGQYLVYDFNGTACITDQDFNIVNEVIPQGVSILDEGISEVTFTCEVKPQDKQQPRVTVRYYTHDTPETIILKPVP